MVISTVVVESMMEEGVNDERTPVTIIVVLSLVIVMVTESPGRTLV